MRIELPSSRWEERIPVGRELPGGKEASLWEGSFPVGRELPGGKRASRWPLYEGASHWVENFPVGMIFLVRRELPSGKGVFHFSSGKEAS